MNVIAKSNNIAPFTRATAVVVTNGLRAVTGRYKVTKPKVAVLPTASRIVGWSLSQDLSRGPIRISSGPGVSSQAIHARLAHSDIRVPDFSAYRKEINKDPDTKSGPTHAKKHNYSYFMATTAGVLTAYGTKGMVVDSVLLMAASQDVLAVSKIEVDLNKIPEGQSMVFKWRGKPLFIRHRDAAEIAKEESVSLAELRDPQTDQERVKRSEWLIVLGICTHLGCVPIANAGDFGGYYCPCHGSHYDASGRIRKGPAPLNLEVPNYEFVEDTVVVG